jgi:hypothetical protein
MWVHLSSRKIERSSLKKTEQRIDFMNKPKGIWIGWAKVKNGEVESEWLDFIGDDHYSDKHFYEVEYDNRVLEVTSDNYLSHLLKYRIDEEEEPYSLGQRIDWIKFSEDYNGIIFTDYYKKYDFYRKDLVFRFHDLLDMKSGCIWNPDSITKWKEI